MAHMEVLLREDIDNLGNRGEIVRVRRGYGRNYLLPKGLAVEATASNVKQIEYEKSVLAKREAKEKAAAEQRSKEFENLVVSFERRVGEEGRLFGSVTSMDIARALEEQGKNIDRHRIRLKDAIKQIGEYQVPVRLHRDITATITVHVTPEGGTIPEATQTKTEDLPGYVAPGDPGPRSRRPVEVEEEEDEDDEE